MQTLRFALRKLRRTPAFTATAVLCLALGIGAATTIFTMINGLFLRPLPGIEDAGRLVTLHDEVSSYPNFQDVRDWNDALAGLAAFGDELMAVRGPGEPERVLGTVVSANYFDVLRTQPAIGRFFLPEEEAAGSPHVAVISHALWRRSLASDSSAVGRTIHVNGSPVTLVGVTPPRFLGTFTGFPVDIWVPFSTASVAAPGFDVVSRGFDRYELIGRLRDGVSFTQAAASLAAVARRLEEAYPGTNRGYSIEIRRHTGFDEELRTPALAFTAALLSIALLVLLIACFNVAGMLIARSLARSREIAIQLAVGSSRVRIVRSLLTESLLLALAGGGLGLLLAAWLGLALENFERNFPIPLAFDFGLDLRVFLFALAASLFTGLAFGIVPALQFSRPELASALKDSPQGISRRPRLQSLFVTAQVAGSAILLVTGGLFLRTLANATERSPGFDLEDIYVAPFIDLALLQRDTAQALSFYLDLITRLESLPEIEAASAAAAVPLAFSGSSRTEIDVPGNEPPPGEEGFEVDFTIASDGFFRTMGISMTGGRDFNAGDGPDTPRVAIINETMARRFWGADDPIGKRFEHLGENLEIVGVVADIKYRALSESIRSFFYVPHAQQPRLRLNLIVRSQAGEAALVARIREEVRALEPDLPFVPPQALRGFLAISLLPQRLAATVGGVLGLLGLFLASLGVYGVVAFSVAQRVREIGIRVAVGADRGDIMMLIAGQGLRLSLVGSFIGLFASLGLTRLLRNMLYGVSAADPLTYVAVAMLLLAITLVGSSLPAHRAARLDPLVALRHE